MQRQGADVLNVRARSVGRGDHDAVERHGGHARRDGEEGGGGGGRRGGGSIIGLAAAYGEAEVIDGVWEGKALQLRSGQGF